MNVKHHTAILHSIFFSIVLASLIAFSTTVSAHNVVGGVYVNGVDIEGEAGFSNGSMANAGTIVKITDQSGTPLGEVQTDDEGYFVFTPKKRITHLFEINMGAGHILKMQIPAEELPDSLNTNLNSTNGTANNTDASQPSSTINVNNQNYSQGNNPPINELMLEKAIAKQIIPLRKEIQALKEKSGMRDIIGGIGYIFGLLGLVAFLRERKLKANK